MQKVKRSKNERLPIGKRTTNQRMAHSSVKTRVAGVKLTAEQYRKIEQRAELCKVSMSAWMRSILLQAASKPAREGYLRLREPDGALT